MARSPLPEERFEQRDTLLFKIAAPSLDGVFIFGITMKRCLRLNAGFLYCDKFSDEEEQ